MTTEQQPVDQSAWLAEHERLLREFEQQRVITGATYKSCAKLDAARAAILDHASGRPTASLNDEQIGKVYQNTFNHDPEWPLPLVRLLARALLAEAALSQPAPEQKADTVHLTCAGPSEGAKAALSFNMNNNVWVKLTDHGRLMHRNNNRDLYARVGIVYKANEEDSDGWSKWQLWELMQEFGQHIGMGRETVFETTIRIDAAACIQAAGATQPNGLESVSASAQPAPDDQPKRDDSDYTMGDWFRDLDNPHGNR